MHSIRQSSSSNSFFDASKDHLCTFRTAFFALSLTFGMGNLYLFASLTIHRGLEFFFPYIATLILVVFPVVVLEKGFGRLTVGGKISNTLILGHRFQWTIVGPLISLVAFCYCASLTTWSLAYLQHFLFIAPHWASVSTLENCIQDLKNRCKGDLVCVVSSKGLCLKYLELSAEKLFHTLVRTVSSYFAKGMFDIYASNFYRLLIIMGLCFLGILFRKGFRTTGKPTVRVLTPKTQSIGMKLNMVVVMISEIILRCISGIASLVVFVVALRNVSWASVFNLNYFRNNCNFLLGSQYWALALGQGLFSLGVGQGYLINTDVRSNRNDNLFFYSLIAIIGDIIVSLCSFLMQHSMNELLTDVQIEPPYNDIMDLRIPYVVYSLSFYKFASTLLQILNRFFFLFLFLGCFGTLFKFYDTFVTCIHHSEFSTERSLKKWHVALPVALVILVPGFFLSSYFDYVVITRFVTFYCSVILLVAVELELVVLPWFCATRLVHDRVGRVAPLLHFITWFTGWILMALLCVFVHPLLATFSGLTVSFGGLLLAPLFAKHDATRPLTYLQCLTYISIFNVETLRWIFNAGYCKGSRCRVPVLWSFLIKYVSSAFVTVLLVRQLFSVFTVRPVELYLLSTTATFFLLIFPCLVILMLVLISVTLPSLVDYLTPPRSLLTPFVVPDDVSTFVEHYYIYKETDMTRVAALE